MGTRTDMRDDCGKAINFDDHYQHAVNGACIGDRAGTPVG